MNWIAILVLALLVGYVISETVSPKLLEGFAAPQRTDIGFAAEGWKEEGGYERDLRYTEAFVDIQGLGVPSDFCRAVAKRSDPDSLRISCALGRRDGMDTMEYNSVSKGEGFRFSRDDYWIQKNSKRMDYCRILKDDDTGEWFAGCAIAGPTGFKKQESRDPDPPAAIQTLLEAYEGILVWFRWLDDREDYAQKAAFSVYGRPVFPTHLKPEVSRGLQLNRWPIASQEAGEPAPPIRDYLRWGEKETFELHQTISPRQIRAISAWVWWDAFEKNAMIVECKNHSDAVGKMDRIALGIRGGGDSLSPAPVTRDAMPAQEVRPELLLAIGQLTEPASPTPKSPRSLATSATYFFEIWDHEHRIMHLEAPMTSAKTGEWQHVMVTATDATAWWPTWQMWINGALVAEKTDGRLSPAMEITENYIGKNMRGCLQDFRIYSTPVTKEKLQPMLAKRTLLHPLP